MYIDKLHVRRSAKKLFSVSCKVIACKIIFWTNADEGSFNAMQRFFSHQNIFFLFSTTVVGGFS
jgi:hypothetical protein